MDKVYVPFFKNDTFWRRIEQELTREVIARIRQRQDLFLTDEKSAELIIQGRIINYEKLILAEDEQDRVVSAATRITVDVKVIRASNGEIMKSRVLDDATDYNQRIGETFEDAQTQTFRILARRIVALLEEDIGKDRTE
jgi:hypothetical protein